MNDEFLAADERERLIRAFQDAVAEEQDAASRVAHLEGELRDAGLDPDDYVTRV